MEFKFLCFMVWLTRHDPVFKDWYYLKTEDMKRNMLAFLRVLLTFKHISSETYNIVLYLIISRKLCTSHIVLILLARWYQDSWFQISQWCIVSIVWTFSHCILHSHSSFWLNLYETYMKCCFIFMCSLLSVEERVAHRFCSLCFPHHYLAVQQHFS
jgi:hypothetical protein